MTPSVLFPKTGPLEMVRSFSPATSSSHQESLTFSLFYGRSLLNHVQLLSPTDKRMILVHCVLESPLPNSCNIEFSMGPIFVDLFCWWCGN